MKHKAMAAASRHGVKNGYQVNIIVPNKSFATYKFPVMNVFSSSLVIDTNLESMPMHFSFASTHEVSKLEL